MTSFIDRDNPAINGNYEGRFCPSGSGLAAEDVGEVCRKDELVVGDDYGLVLRSGLSEETGHSADGLDDDVGAEEGALFGECGVLRTEGVGDGEAESAAASGVAARADRGRLQGQVGRMLADEAGGIVSMKMSANFRGVRPGACAMRGFHSASMARPN